MRSARSSAPSEALLELLRSNRGELGLLHRRSLSLLPAYPILNLDHLTLPRRRFPVVASRLVPRLDEHLVHGEVLGGPDQGDQSS